MALLFKPNTNPTIKLTYTVVAVAFKLAAYGGPAWGTQPEQLLTDVVCWNSSN